MIYGTRFNIIHMPKTGGTWLRRVCESLPSDFIEGTHPGHLPYSGLTKDQAQKPTYIFVRNPWDWYVSVYGHRHGNIVNKRHEFAKPRDALPKFYRDMYDQYAGQFEDSLQDLVAWEGDFGPSLSMSDRLNWMREILGDLPHVIVKRFEAGPAEVLQEILTEHHGELSPQILALLKMPPQNVSDRNHEFRGYRGYYTDETRALIETREMGLIREFGYEF